MYWKITWPPFIHTSALKIAPLVVWIYTMGFVYFFIDIAVFCFIFESVLSIVNQRKNSIIFTGLNVFFKALNFCFWLRSLRAFIIFYYSRTCSFIHMTTRLLSQKKAFLNAAYCIFKICLKKKTKKRYSWEYFEFFPANPATRVPTFTV